MKQRAIILSAALLAAALTAMTVGARSTQPHLRSGDAPAATQQQTAPRETTGRASAESFSYARPVLRLHGIIACAPAANPGLACDKLEPLLAK